MDLFEQRLKEFSDFYQSDPAGVFSLQTYLADEKWYKELLVDVVSAILTAENIQTGKFRDLLIRLIKRQLDWESFVSSDRVLYFKDKRLLDGSTLHPSDAFFNMLTGTFQLWANLRLMLENDDSKKVALAFQHLLYGQEEIDVRIRDFQRIIDDTYARIYRSGKTNMSNAPKEPTIPLNMIALFLACVHPKKYYFYKATSYRKSSELLSIPFEKSSDYGLTYLNAIEFANTIHKKLNDLCGSVDNIDTQSFIYSLPRIGPDGAKRLELGLAPRIAQTDKDDVEEVDYFLSEQEMERYIAKHWQEIDPLKGYEMERGGAPHGGQYVTDGLGTIDLLGHSTTKKEWLVVELKKLEAGDEAVAQMLRYMGYVKEKLAAPNERVFGLLITGEFDAKIKSAISVVPDASWLLYSVYIEYKGFALKQE